MNAISKKDSWTDLYSIITAFAIVLFGLWFFVQLKIIPKKVSEELDKIYSDYQISK